MRKAKPPILRPEEEREILELLINKVRKREPVRRQDVIDKVVKFLQSDKRKNPFRNGVPGDKWFSLFRRRHNSQFVRLESKMLRAVEKLGFTEKVKNTVTYPRPPIGTETIQTVIESKRPVRSKSMVADEPSPLMAALSSSPGSEDGTDDGDRSQESQSDSTDFQPGSKLEVMDFNEKCSNSKKVFMENEKVIAVWAYNHKYPATVRQVLPNDKYEVLFCDGYSKILRGCKLFKATEEDLQNVQLPPPKKPAPPMGADPLDPDLGPKEERRLKKRRMDVLESYRPHKRQKLDSPQMTPETPSPPIVTSHKPKEMPKVVLKMRGRPAIKHRPRIQDDEDDDDNGWLDDEDDEEPEPEVPDPEPDKSLTPKRRRKKKKKIFDESTYVYRGPKNRAGLEEDHERWNTEIPEGVSPVQIKDQEGYYRESIIIPDRKMPTGWTKHTMRRKSGAKWDVFLVNPDGRKFRSRNELRNYFAELKQPFPEDCFDFMVGRKMEMIRTQVETRRKLLPCSKLMKISPVHKRSPGHKASPTYKRSPAHKTSDSEGQSEAKKSAGECTPDLRRVRTLLPKGRLLDPDEIKKEQQSPGPSTASPLFSPPFPLTELRTPDGGFTCCGKSFRKENLFQMHMKHYHPEYSNLFGSTPNVADLAYARTVGEPLEDSRAEAMTPRNSLLERVTKYEADRKALSETIVTPLDSSVTKPAQEMEPVPDTQPMAKEPASPVQKKEEELPASEEKATSEDSLVDVKPKLEPSSEISEEKNDETTENIVVGPPPTPPSPSPPPSPPVVEIEEPSTEKLEESIKPVATEEPTPVEPPPLPTPPVSLPPPPVTPSIPVIKPVSKLTPGSSKSAVTSEAVIVQTTSSPRGPVTITKYIPPGQKPTLATTKLTISMASSSEKEVKPTIKTLLPMRPPPAEPKEVHEPQKPKEAKPKDEAEEETPVKSRPRKRTVSESLPKKPKLLKPTTGSLEEEPLVENEEVSSSPATNNTSYRFSRNRSQVPRVSLEKLNITPDSNGRVVLASPEDKNAKTAGRRQFKSFKAASKINKRMKGGENSSGDNSEVPLPTEATDVVYENLRKEEIINCTCGYMEEDGLMIQCDLCLCWQHGLCNNIDKEADVPEKYVCYICQNPARQRLSTRHVHNQDWLKEGRLPSLPFRPKTEESVAQRESMLKKSHDLVASLLQLKTVIRSLRVKTNIATKSDHPKLYLWAKSWKNDSPDAQNENEESKKQEVLGPQPEAAIDETECRLRLLEHVEDYQHQVEDRLTSIQAQIAALESEDPDLASDEASDHYPVTKQTVQMVLRDLNTVRKVAALN